MPRPSELFQKPEKKTEGDDEKGDEAEEGVEGGAHQEGDSQERPHTAAALPETGEAGEVGERSKGEVDGE